MDQLVPEILYHYCPPDSFMSIVRHGALRLSHASGMNDFHELKHFYQLLEREKANWSAIGQDEYINDVLKQCDRHGQDLYLTSFSEEADCLSQWRGYADDGLGYNIGFSRNCLPNVGKPEPNLRPLFDEFLFKVTYDETQAIQLIRRTLERAPVKTKVEYSGSVVLASAHFTSFAFGYKSAAFSEEREWRVGYWPFDRERTPSLVANLEEADFRNSRYGIIPYFDHPFHGSQLPILKVLLGPKNPSDPKFVQAFLKKFGYNDVIVERSSASYR